MSDGNGKKCVEIELSQENIEGLTVEGQLKILLKVAIANHNNIRCIYDILEGPEGIVVKVKNHSKGFRFFWGILTGFAVATGTALLALYGYLFAHVQKGG